MKENEKTMKFANLKFGLTWLLLFILYILLAVVAVSNFAESASILDLESCIESCKGIVLLLLLFSICFVALGLFGLFYAPMRRGLNFFNKFMCIWWIIIGIAETIYILKAFAS